MKTALDKFKLFDMKLIAWAQYLHWADINFNRYMCGDGEEASANIAVALQWFASEFVVIEGWREIEHHDDLIDNLLQSNAEDVELLRRARNGVFHFQKRPLDDKLLGFLFAYGKCGWLVDLHEAFLKYLRGYPEAAYPYQERKDEFVTSFFDIIGWKPEPACFPEHRAYSTILEAKAP